MASSGFRHGQTGMIIGFDRTTNKLKFDFDGGALTKGKTAGSTAPHTSSPIFLLDGVIHIPSVCVSYQGKALGEKTPLLRANDAMSEHGCRLLDQLGYDAATSGGLKANTLECMKEIQHECFKMGIPLETRPREVTPGQFEFAPECRNLIVMQVVDEVAAKHGLAAPPPPVCPPTAWPPSPSPTSSAQP